MVESKALDSLAWGLFIVLVGVGWYVGSVYEMDTGAYIALGVGLIARARKCQLSGYG